MTVIKRGSYNTLHVIAPGRSSPVTIAFRIGACNHRIRGDWPIPIDVGRNRSATTRVSVSPPMAGRLQWQEYVVDLICK